MQEKTDNDDMSKAVKLNFIEEMTTLFSPVCTLMPLGLAARIWCHLPDLSHTETTKADYSEWNCSVEILVRFPVPKGSGEGRPIPGIFLAWQFVAKMFIKSGERWYRQHVNSQQSELGNLIRKYRWSQGNIGWLHSQGRHFGCHVNEEMSDVRKDSDAMLVYSRLHLGVGKFRVCVTSPPCCTTI